MSKPGLLWPPFDPSKPSEGVGIEDGRTCDYRFKLYKSDRSPLEIADDDVVRFKLSDDADSEDPTLEISSAAATGNGSVITIESVGDEDAGTPAEVLVRFAQDDTDGLAANDDGTIRREDYFGELLLVDNSETDPADACKRIAYGPVTVLPAAGGDVGLT